MMIQLITSVDQIQRTILKHVVHVPVVDVLDVFTPVSCRKNNHRSFLSNRSSHFFIYFIL